VNENKKCNCIAAVGVYVSPWHAHDRINIYYRTISDIAVLTQ